MRTYKYKVTEHWYCGHASGKQEFTYNVCDRLKAETHVLNYNNAHLYDKCYATIDTIVEGQDAIADKSHEVVATYFDRHPFNP